MNQKERMLAGLPYKAWMDGLAEERLACKKKIYEFNCLSPHETEQTEFLLRDILGKAGKNLWIETPFHCDYGWTIEARDDFYANYNLVILDVGEVTIGNNVVIGAGSVVSKDIPDNCVAVGNPCNILREITNEDRLYYFKDRWFDEEAVAKFTLSKKS